MSQSKKFAENNQRPEVNVLDLIGILETNDPDSIVNLTEFLQQSEKKYENSQVLLKRVLKETTEEDDIHTK